MSVICMFCRKEKVPACCPRSVAIAIDLENKNANKKLTIEDRWNHYVKSLYGRSFKVEVPK